MGHTLPALLGWTSCVIAWAQEVIGRAGEARAWGADVIDWARGAVG